MVEGGSDPPPRASDAQDLRVAVELPRAPALGAVQLRRLTPQVIVRFRADLEQEGVGTEASRREPKRASRRAAGRLGAASLVAPWWRHVRERTLPIEDALSDGRTKEQKNHRPPRTVDLHACSASRPARGSSRPAVRRTSASSSRRSTASHGANTTTATGASGSSVLAPKPSAWRRPGPMTCATASPAC